MVVPQLFYLTRNWLERVAILIRGEAAGVGVTELATSTRTPGVHPPSVGYCYCVRLATRYGGNDVRAQVFYNSRSELVWATILVLRHFRGFRVTELAAATSTPAVEQTLSRQGDCVSIAARYLHNAHVLQASNKQRHWLVGVALDILGHVFRVAVPKLPTGACAPAVELAVDSDRSGVAVSSSYLADLHPCKGLDQASCRLVWITVLVLGQVLQ
mmetsp:Transcript_28084/g.65630  ORF Transcript_28084/g.65630 Transcript_28084/m.65630 type:complete len:214 (-) Transcript_28084:139-780(-)